MRVRARASGIARCGATVAAVLSMIVLIVFGAALALYARALQALE